LLKYVKLKTSTVLTVDQTFEIILNFNNTKNWENSIINTIPKRKMMFLNENNIDDKSNDEKSQDEDEK
jgi:hypothetical protein